MVESIGVSLVSTIVSFLFEKSILNGEGLNFTKPYSRYEKSLNRDRIYVFTSLKGDMSDLQKAKDRAIEEMVTIIDRGYKNAVVRAFEGRYSKKEIEFLKKLQKDDRLLDFVKQNIIFENVKCDDNKKEIYIKGYLDINVLKEYEKRVVLDVKKRVLDFQFDDMMNELKK